MTQGIEAAASAAVTVRLVPRLQVLQQFSPIVKALIGAGGAWVLRNRGGMLVNVAYGVGIGLAIDGIADLALGGGR